MPVRAPTATRGYDAAVTDNPYRLPRTVVPQRYTLVLEPDLAAATFTGTVEIDVALTEGVDEIVMNAIDLGIDSVSVDGVAATFQLDEATERLAISAATPFGESKIVIGFTGTLNDKLRGWYRSTYRDADGAEHVIATSQMQATTVVARSRVGTSPTSRRSSMSPWSSTPNCWRCRTAPRSHARCAPTARNWCTSTRPCP